ncbi:MAG: ATP synthase subunit I [Desulfomicrobium sp.]|jgi:hypothetical protein|nr:ATP synthase subunit I [Pseudomonadota bacterium]MBV1712259.1 ATP synthase subunit I [Desulfomicrobium sp.]MBU4572896.1 ATP synthase subunit I [Pseudomonadota bacterium]MBU4594892.1 ATP synthase subunit I [Pseudomonadota bacterium]MBV1718469.1 ATP synthase subunit I [Desulfomicrobium sp.]
MRKKIERFLYARGFHVPEVRKMALHQVYFLCGALPAVAFGRGGVDLVTGVLLGTLNFLALGKLIQELVYLQKSAVIVQIFSFYGRLLLTALAFYVLIVHMGSSGVWLLLGFSTVLINILLWGMSQFLGKTSKEA